MAARTRKTADSKVRKVVDALRTEYKKAYPKAKIHVRRENSYSIDIRIIDPGFIRKRRLFRFQRVWEALDRALDDRVIPEIGYMQLLTPKEAENAITKAGFSEKGAIRV